MPTCPLCKGSGFIERRKSSRELSCEASRVRPSDPLTLVDLSNWAIRSGYGRDVDYVRLGINPFKLVLCPLCKGTGKVSAKKAEEWEKLNID